MEINYPHWSHPTAIYNAVILIPFCVANQAKINSSPPANHMC